MKVRGCGVALVGSLLVSHVGLQWRGRVGGTELDWVESSQQDTHCCCAQTFDVRILGGGF